MNGLVDETSKLMEKVETQWFACWLGVVRIANHEQRYVVFSNYGGYITLRWLRRTLKRVDPECLEVGHATGSQLTQRVSFETLSPINDADKVAYSCLLVIDSQKSERELFDAIWKHLLDADPRVEYQRFKAELSVAERPRDFVQIKADEDC